MADRPDSECPFCRHPLLTALLVLATLVALVLQLNVLWTTFA